ncbi:MAG: 50S ribosomal protein L11 methyltransferase [Bacteroidota bacterium]|nr:50S ribosomal protein L11 methyltransferase [Bacteroidota bacterium]
MKTYIEISISANELQREMLLPTMIELGCEGFQETDISLLCYINKNRWTDDKIQILKADLENILQTISVNSVIQFREIKEENWNEQWEKTIQPIEVGSKLVIKPSWCDYENRDDRIVIQIDPKMSFGTGYHETTRLTLMLLEKYLDVGCKMLDVGTGTGILAISAIKLGAASAIGTDIDEWSIENATENVMANSVVDKVNIKDGNTEEYPSAGFNIITANLTLNTNIDLLSEFKRLLCWNGKLLLSGLLDVDIETMKRELAASEFNILETFSENEWIAIAAQKST